MVHFNDFSVHSTVKSIWIFFRDTSDFVLFSSSFAYSLHHFNLFSIFNFNLFIFSHIDIIILEVVSFCPFFIFAIGTSFWKTMVCLCAFFCQLLEIHFMQFNWIVFMYNGIGKPKLVQTIAFCWLNGCCEACVFFCFFGLCFLTCFT